MTGHSTASKMLSRCLQYFIAAILLATGIGKALDVQGFVDVLMTYQMLADWMLYPVALAMIVIELSLSLWLFSGYFLVWGAFASLGLHIIFSCVASIAYLRGLDIPNCGCFGVFLARPLDGWTIVEDLVMVAISGLLILLVRKNQNVFNYESSHK